MLIACTVIECNRLCNHCMQSQAAVVPQLDSHRDHLSCVSHHMHHPVSVVPSRVRDVRTAHVKKYQSVCASVLSHVSAAKGGPKC